MDCRELFMEIWGEAYLLRKAIMATLVPLTRDQGLTIQQFLLLQGVCDGSIRTIGDITEEIDITQSNASALCKRLEQGGFLLRRRSSQDERVVELQVTDAGHRALEAVGRRLAELGRVAAAAQPERLTRIQTGFQELNALLTDLKTALDQERNGDNC